MEEKISDNIRDTESAQNVTSSDDTAQGLPADEDAQALPNAKRSLSDFDVKKFFDNNWLYFAAPLLVCGLFMCVLYILKIYPFSHTSMSNYDLLAQICPFLEHFYDVFEGRSSLFYSTSVIGGADVFGTLAYCAVSPFTFLFLLFGKGNVYYAVSFVLPIKLSCVAVAAIYFFKTKFKKVPDHIVLTVAILYAYCGYMFVANTYINWVDFLIYMPFCILGFEKLVKTGKVLYFSIAYALMIYTCFSISCFAMFIIFLIFAAYVLIMGGEGVSRKELFAKLCVSLAIAVALALPIMLPAFKAYIESGRNTGLFENMGKDLDAKHLYAKTSYILSDALFVMLTVFYFFKFGVRNKKSVFFLVTLILIMMPVFVDEVCNLLNFGSYMSYALRFGFLNASFMMYLSGLVLDDLKYLRSRNKIVNVIVTVVFFCLTALVVVFMVTYNNSVTSENLYDFSSKYAHSLGGLEVIAPVFGAIAGLLVVAAVIYRFRLASIKVVIFMLVAVFAVQVAFYNIHLVKGNKFNPVRYDQYEELFTSGKYDGAIAAAENVFYGGTVSVTRDEQSVDAKTFTHKMSLPASLNGSYVFNTADNYKYVKVTVAGSCAIGVYAKSASSINACKLNMYESLENVPDQASGEYVTKSVAADSVTELIYTAEDAGDYYFIAVGKSYVDIYDVIVYADRARTAVTREVKFTEDATFTGYTQLADCVSVNAFTTDLETSDYYRIKDYDAAISNDAPFTTHTASYSVFSSVIDRKNLAATEFFGYGGNNINSIESKNGLFFGDALLGYRYYFLHNDQKTHSSESRSYNARLEDAQTSYFAVGVNTLVFPNAYYVKSGDLVFDGDYYHNMQKLYSFLGGEGQLFDEYEIKESAISYDEETGVYTVRVYTVDEGQWYMQHDFPEDYQLKFSLFAKEESDMKDLTAGEVINFNYHTKYAPSYFYAYIKNVGDKPLTVEDITTYCRGNCLPLSKIKAVRDLLYTRAAKYTIEGGDDFKVNVTADGDDCYLFMNYVAIEGFEVTVNGKKSEFIDNGLNFMLVKLDEGENNVEIKYHSPYIKLILLGILAAAAIVAVLLLLLTKWKAFYSKLVPVIAISGAVLSVAVFGFFFAYPTALFIVKLVKLLWGLIF